MAINDVDLRNQKLLAWACTQLSQGACLIVNNSANAIGKARNLVENARGKCQTFRVPPMQFMLPLTRPTTFTVPTRRVPTASSARSKWRAWYVSFAISALSCNSR